METTSKPDIRTLRDARYMALDHRPVSEEARALCRELAIKLSEADAKRAYRRGAARQRQFEDAIGALVADLLFALSDDEDGWAYRSAQVGTFKGDHVSFRTFRSIIGPAQTHGLIEVLPGFNERSPFVDIATGKKPSFSSFSSPNNMTSRYRAAPVLRAIAERYGITAKTAAQHFLQCLPAHPLELRSGKHWQGGEKVGGKPMKFNKTPQTEKLEADLHELNRFLDGFKLTGGVHRGYRRIFNRGDDPAFAWNKGGRLYSQGRPSYQQLSGQERARMTLDGQPVAEIDITASFLTILHGLKGVPFDNRRDPYAIWKPLPRDVVKAWVTMTLGYHQFHDEWPEEVLEALAEKGIKPEPICEVRPVILHYVPILKDWPEQELTVFDLMFRESEAVMGTMLALMRGHRIPSLSVHDSLLVPATQVPLTQRLLRAEYRKVCGVEPGLKVKTVGLGI